MKIHDRFEIFTCALEITTPRGTQRQIIEAPRIMIEQEFLDIVYQAAQSMEPIKVKLSREIPIYNQFEENYINRECSISFGNQEFVRVYGEDLVQGTV